MKNSEIMIFIFGIVAVALMIVSSIVVNAQAERNYGDLKQFAAKKEDLINSQDRLQIAIQDLNATLQMKAVEQDSLIKQINSLSNEITDVAKVNASLVMPAPITVSTPTPTPVSKPTPAPRPRRVSRAS